MNNKRIPEGTISRLFIYLRELTNLVDINIRTISSAELGERVNLSDVQVRKDLGYFGQFGVSGSGYDTYELMTVLKKILGKGRVWNVALVGAGRLGSALLAYPGFEAHGLNIAAAFDSDSAKAGSLVNEITIHHIDELEKEIKEKKIAIGIITVPAKNAQEAANKLVAAGVECILNFAPVPLSVPDDIKVKNVDFLKELEVLSYFLANKSKVVCKN